MYIIQYLLCPPSWDLHRSFQKAKYQREFGITLNKVLDDFTSRPNLSPIVPKIGEGVLNYLLRLNYSLLNCPSRVVEGCRDSLAGGALQLAMRAMACSSAAPERLMDDLYFLVDGLGPYMSYPAVFQQMESPADLGNPEAKVLDMLGVGSKWKNFTTTHELFALIAESTSGAPSLCDDSAVRVASLL